MNFSVSISTDKSKKPARKGAGVIGRDLSMRRGASPVDAQMMREVQGKIMRMYDAALTDNWNADQPISLTSANAEILTSFIAVRSRMRKQERDDPYAAAIIRSFMKNVGGDNAFRFESNVGKYVGNKFVKDKDANRKIEDWWRKLARPENCTVRRNMSRQELYLQAIAAMVRDGGIIWRHRRAFDNDFAYAVEALEIDHLDQNYQRPKVGGDNEIQFGIEVDDYRAPLYYHLWTRHPGDVLAYSNYPRWRDRVPAKDVVLLCDIKTRAEQWISVSRFSSIIRRLHRLNQFDVAHVTAALMNCCKSIWITKGFAAAPEFITEEIRTRAEQWINQEAENSANAAGDDGEAQGQRTFNVTPGEMNELEYGQDVKQLEGRFPMESAKDFMKTAIRSLATGSGTAYPEIGQDLESVSFSAARVGLAESRDGFKIDQKHVIDNAVFPHFSVALRCALQFGVLQLPYSRLEEFRDGAKFCGRRWGYINPLQDVQADILSVEAGLDSRSHVISESDRGGDVEEVDSEIQADREIDKAHELDFSAADVTKPTISKGLPGEDTPNPLDAKTPQTAKPTPEGPTPMKQRSAWQRIERTLRTVAETDPDDHENAAALEQFLQVKQARNGKLSALLGGLGEEHDP